MAEAEIGADILPSILPTVPLIAAGAVGVYGGWKLGDFIYYHLLDKNAPTSGSSGVTTLQWFCFTGAGANVTTGVPGCGNASVSITGQTWGTSGNLGYNTGGSVLDLNGNFTVCVTWVSSCTLNASETAYYQSFAGAGNLVTWTAGSSCASITTTCESIWRTESQQVSATQVTKGSSSDFAGAATTRTGDFNLQYPSLAQIQQGVSTLIPRGSPPDATSYAAGCALAVSLDPAYQCSGGSTTVTPTTSPPFILPQPTLDDTYQTYTEKLRIAGYLGNVTVTDDSMSEYPYGSYGARLLSKSLTSIQIGTLGTLYLYDQTTGVPIAWPPNPGLVTPGATTNITLSAVPAAYDPLSHGATPGTETGAGGVPGGGSTCNCPPLDFSPLENTNFGTKFPFGIATWFTTIFGSVPTTGTPISFNLTNPVGGTYSVSLGSSEWVSTYRPIVWPIIEFLFVVGGIAILCYRILGMGDSGDSV